MQHQDMLRMANQIASFFNGSGPEAAVRDAADHINKFWDPRMRTMLMAHLDKGGEGLDETIVKAAALIKRPATPSSMVSSIPIFAWCRSSRARRSAPASSRGNHPLLHLA